MKNLQFLRKNRGKTQDIVAFDLGIPKTTYATYEQQKAFPNPTMLLKIADYFGVSIDYLLGHETKGIIHTDSFNEAQQNIIESIKDLDEDLCGKAEAYIEGLKETQQERDNIRKKYSS